MNVTDQLLSQQEGLQSQLDSFLQTYIEGGNGVAITPQGLSWTGQNGPLPNAANAAHLALMYGDALEGGDHDYEVQPHCRQEHHPIFRFYNTLAAV